jgi:hypothetical protein
MAFVIAGVVALLVLACVLGAYRRGGRSYGNVQSVRGTRGMDRLRRSDPEAAARLETQRAESQLRGSSFGGFSGF